MVCVTNTKAGKEASQGEGTGEQKLGVVFWLPVAISAVFVLWGVLFTVTCASATATVVGWITDTGRWS
jgi:glycine betaine transporter